MKNRMISLACLALMVSPLAALAQQKDGSGDKIPTLVISPVESERHVPVNESEVFKVYDLSVLGSALNSPGMPEGAAEMKLIMGLGDAFSLHVNPIGPSLFLVGAMQPEHEKIASLMLQVRETTAERYRVELATLSLPTATAPAIGTAFNIPDASGVRIDHVVQQRTSATFEAMREQTYIADWQPVVGNDSVGYQPLPKTAASGLEARVWVGAGDGKSVELRVDGKFSQAHIQDVELPLATGGGKLLIGLPVHDKRSVHADVRLKLGESSVVGVATGFEPGTSIVTVVKVERAD